jgi:hypothetical protein
MRLEATNRSYERRILEVKSKKSQVPATHQLILKNLLQVPAPHHFLIINLLSSLEKTIYQSEKFNHFRGAKRDKLLGKEKE